MEQKTVDFQALKLSMEERVNHKRANGEMRKEERLGRFLIPSNSAVYDSGK